MAIPYYSNIDLKQNQIIQPVIDNETIAPTSPLIGQMYYNSGNHILYYYNGTQWMNLSIDSTLSSTSTNGLQNKVIYSELGKKLNLSGGTMTGDITFTTTGDTGTSKALIWSGSTDGAKIFYDVPTKDEGILTLQMSDDANAIIKMTNTTTNSKNLTFNPYAGSITADSFIGNASTANTLKTARNININQDASGSASFNGGSNITIGIKRRGASVGQTGNTNTITKPWYKFASISVSGGYEDRTITFHVSSGYADSTTNLGILTAHYRTNTSGGWESGELHWEYANNGIDTTKFVLAHSTTSPTIVELWVKCNTAWQGYHFDVISETSRETNNQDREWNLIHNWAAGSQDSITSGYTQIVSSLNTIKNNISGNATSATNDSAGQAINSTYIKNISISGTTLTFTKGNGSTGTATVNVGTTGHTIQNSSGTNMSTRQYLQFKGATVTDDSTNNKTIVTVDEQNITVDSALSSTSTNPLQNKVIYNTLQSYVTSSDKSVGDIVTISKSDYDTLVSSNKVVANRLYNVIEDNNSLSYNLPIGFIGIWPGNLSTIPTNYKICDGSKINVKDYPEYAAAVGTTYGGDGTTTVGLPNMALAYTAIDSAGAHNVIKVKADGYTENLINLDQEIAKLMPHKYKAKVTTAVAAGGTYTLPAKYEVGNESLDVYLNGERLIACSSTSDTLGHYYEVGTSGSSSSSIKLTSDWSLAVGDVIECVIRGIYP